MADVKYVPRRRARAFIDLQAFDLRNVICQPDVIVAFTTEELIEISQWIERELENRARGSDG